MAHADMAEPIEHTLIGKNMARGYQIFDDLLVHGRYSLVLSPTRNFSRQGAKF